MGSMLPLTAILNPSGGEVQQESSYNSRPSPSTAIHFYPFEDLDEASIREVRKYQIHSFGRIQDSCRRIPYNTGKRDFYEKTGRTCFEVFQYDFKIPGSDTTWTVMWDYKIGLVRTTPFFKCCDYSKTISAKMLNQNPGLRDISHSITGGAIRAQGYWMPFECARAVCATFCYPISGALIPLFGPKFPAECIPPNTQHYARMTISPAIIQRSKREAEEFRRLYGNMPSPPTHNLPPSSSTRTHGHGGYRLVAGSPASAYHHHQSDRHHHGWQTGTDSDVEGSSLDRFPRLPPLQTAHLPTPVLSSAESSYNASSTAQSSPRFWTAVNHSHTHDRGAAYPPHYIASNYGQGQHEYRYDQPKSRYHHLEPDPYRSAVPSLATGASTSTSTSHHQFYHQPPRVPLPSSTSSREAPQRMIEREVLPAYRTVARAANTSSYSTRYGHGDKRPFDDYDHDYDAGESANGSSPEAASPKVFYAHGSSKAHIQSQQQQTNTKPLHAEAIGRRCSPVMAPGNNHGSDTSTGRGKNTNTSSKESDRTSESSTHEHELEEARERDARRRSILEKERTCTLPPIVGGYHRKDSRAKDRSPHSHSPKSDRTSREEVENNRRTPSFSGAERVAALTLLHLGILEKESNSHSHSKQQGREKEKSSGRRHSKTSDTEMHDQSPHSRRGSPRHHDTTGTGTGNFRETIYASPSSRTPRPPKAIEADISESTVHASPSSVLISRRGSRDRKRRKGRSI